MNTYNIPEEPAGPVWGKDGHKWTRLGVGLWLRDGEKLRCLEWHQLLHWKGPLTDTPPVKIGDKITLSEFSEMPVGSVAGAPRDVFINYHGLVFTDAQVDKVPLSVFGDDVVTVLRVGDGEE